MRALTNEELGFVSGGNVEGPMFTPQGWQQLSGVAELVVVIGQRVRSGGGNGDFYDANQYATSFEETSFGRTSNSFGGMSNWFNELTPGNRAQILGGGLIVIGASLALAAAVTPAGMLVFGVFAINTTNFAATGLGIVGTAVGIAGALADDPEVSDKLRGLL